MTCCIIVGYVLGWRKRSHGAVFKEKETQSFECMSALSGSQAIGIYYFSVGVLFVMFRAYISGKSLYTNIVLPTVFRALKAI